MNKNNILMTLEDIIGSRFGRYSKYIIQERAIPDARDGLKPGQRRIIYSMYKEGNTFSKAYRKSAKTVGNVMGNYHPHGDSSIYEAMVRMSQPWKLRYPLVDMHGNNGSVDDDPAAAMRYTEARMSQMAGLLVQDLEKDTVKWSLNFDDTELEPTVFPSKAPNFLINGASGIASGYATEVPPHNLSEIMDALIYRILNPECDLKDIMKIVKGPDFPTGGILTNVSGIKDAFETGRGRMLLKSKATVDGKEILITEIPYGVYKSALVREIDNVLSSGNVSGIEDVRDESDRKGLRIVINLKAGIDGENILNYLYQKTRLQTWYNYNMVSIIDKKPVLLGLVPLLDNYKEHQTNVLVNRLNYSKNKLESRLHILEGLVIAIQNIDEIISIIRKSKSKQESKLSITERFGFSNEQAEAIVNLRLYRLSFTDVEEIELEKSNILSEVKGMELILSSQETINKQIIAEFEEVKSLYGDKRRTSVKKGLGLVKVDTKSLIENEKTWVSLSKDGYMKRSTIKSYKSSQGSAIQLNDGDALVMYGEVNTFDHLLIFFDTGKYVSIPVFKILEKKWREKGEHISTLVSVKGEDNFVAAIPVAEFDSNILVFGTQTGMVKRTILSELKVSRWTKPSTCMKLKTDDKLIGVEVSLDKSLVSFISKEGFINKYKASEITIVGSKTAGIKGINLTNTIATGFTSYQDSDQLVFITNQNQAKRIKSSEIPFSSRTTKGVRINKHVQSKPQDIIWFNRINIQDELQLITQDGIKKAFVKDIALLKIEDGNNKFMHSKDLLYSVWKQASMSTIKMNKKLVKQDSEKVIDKKDTNQLNLFDIIENI